MPDWIKLLELCLAQLLQIIHFLLVVIYARVISDTQCFDKSLEADAAKAEYVMEHQHGSDLGFLKLIVGALELFVDEHRALCRCSLYSVHYPPIRIKWFQLIICHAE